MLEAAHFSFYIFYFIYFDENLSLSCIWTNSSIKNANCVEFYL
jgi:hypothetical protein